MRAQCRGCSNRGHNNRGHSNRGHSNPQFTMQTEPTNVLSRFRAVNHRRSSRGSTSFPSWIGGWGIGWLALGMAIAGCQFQQPVVIGIAEDPEVALLGTAISEYLTGNTDLQVQLTALAAGESCPDALRSQQVDLCLTAPGELAPEATAAERYPAAETAAAAAGWALAEPMETPPVDGTSDRLVVPVVRQVVTERYPQLRDALQDLGGVVAEGELPGWVQRVEQGEERAIVARELLESKLGPLRHP